MHAAPDHPPEARLRQRRSRNGCNECRRLHRRCDETKPACLSCIEAGKVCSYARSLSWGGRPFRRSAFGTALESGVVEIPISASLGDPPHRTPFVYGQAEGSASGTNRSGQSDAGSGPRSMVALSADRQDEESSSDSAVGAPRIAPTSIRWLSDHYRGLLDHFIGTTVMLFSADEAVCAEIRSTIIPMAVDTDHGFSLLAALLSLASVHRLNLGLHEDAAEPDYWQIMSVGHLRRPTIREDVSTRDVATATALILCVKEVISINEQPSDWKLHLHAACSLLRENGERPHSATPSTPRLLDRIARSLQICSILPSPLSSPSPGDNDAMPFEEAQNISQLPNDIAVILGCIRSLRSERNALYNIQSNSSSSYMQPLWSALRGRCLEVIIKLRAFTDDTNPSGASTIGSERLYGYAALVQMYSAALDLPLADAGLRNTVETAMGLIRLVLTNDNHRVSADLLFPLFTIGCFVHSAEDRNSIKVLMAGIAEKFGKGNARLATAFLAELWVKLDSQYRLAKQSDIDALMVEKGWDLSLW